jgi:hypothetical protein
MANPTGTINADEDHTGRTILKSAPTVNQDAATKKYVDDNAGGGGGSVSDAAYDATTWNGDTTHAPSKNAVRDKIESLSAAGNAFSTIAVSGQSDVVADSTGDTLTLAAGSNVTLTTNAGTDTVTIAASGGGGGGDASTNTATSVDSEITLFSGTTGKLLKRATGTGIAAVTSGVFSISGTSTVATFGQIELGDTGDTSITRSSAAHIAVEGHVLLDIETAQTATTKRIVPRTHTVTSATSWTPDFDTYDQEIQTALAGALTVNNPTYTSPNEGEKRILRLKDNGTARAITWNSVFRASSDLALPTTTILSKTLYLGFIYNSTDGKWDLLALLNNF